MTNARKNDVVAALTEDHVVTVTGLTRGQLRAWDRKGFFKPNFAYDNRRAAYSRIYSFRDVVGLKTVETLRSEYKIGFRKLHVVAKELKKRGFNHWSDTKLYVLKKEVHFKNPKTGDVESLKDGQLAMLPVIDVINEVTAKVIELKSRDQSSVGRVERQKYVARNSWVVAGTRIPTATIRRYHDAGYTMEQILEEYPSLSKSDVEAALAHENTLAKTA